MGIVIDTRPFKYRLLTESQKNSNTVEVEGLMQIAGDSNGNGRVYPKEVLEREVQRLKKDFIANGNAFGELDHPDSPTVSLKNVSHVIKDLWWEGDNLMGRVEVLNTPFGNIVKEILKAGFSVGISSRGIGSVTEINDGSGRVKVDDDYSLITWDFVSNPSVQNAFVKQLNEGQTKQLNKYSKLNTLLNDILRN